MGVVQNVGRHKMPRQTEHVGSRVLVCFGYDTTDTIGGTILRDDAEPPHRTIIGLFDGRIVLASECQYHIKSQPTSPVSEATTPAERERFWEDIGRPGEQR